MSNLKKFFMLMAGSNPEYPFGTIYSKSNFTSLSEWTIQGVITPTVSGGTINFTGGTTVYTNTLNLTSPYTQLENYSITTQVKITGGGTNGWMIGIRSYNGVAPHSIFAFYSGGLIGISAGSPTGIVSSTPSLASSVNDVIELTLSKSGTIATISARNVTTSSSVVTTSYTFVLTSISEPLTPNTGRFCIGTFGSTFSVLSYAVSTTVVKRARLCIVGDSITEGYCASTYANSYSRLLNSNYPSTIILAGESDRTAEVLLRVQQIIDFNPRVVLLAVGVNDVATSVPSGTYTTNLSSIYTQLINAGLTVRFLLAKSTSLNLTTLNNYITSTYSSSIIIDPGTMIAGDFIADGFHYNDSGNLKVYNAIVASGKI